MAEGEYVMWVRTGRLIFFLVPIVGVVGVRTQTSPPRALFDAKLPCYLLRRGTGCVREQIDRSSGAGEISGVDVCPEKGRVYHHANSRWKEDGRRGGVDDSL